MDLGLIVLGAALGAAAGAAVGYTHNWIIGWGALALGLFVVFSTGGAGPGGTINTFFETVGPIAGAAALVGAGIGYAAGDHFRSSGTDGAA